MKIKRLPIDPLILIEPEIFSDTRGFFCESYRESDFIKVGIHEYFMQDNFSYSKKGVIRGLHYQVGKAAQAKLVRVVHGTVWDVAVDIRKGSPTFLKWHGRFLSSENRHIFYIPAGFAHGFVAMTDNVHLAYKCSSEYSPDHERGIRYDDPTLSIPWQTMIEGPVEISEKDLALPYVSTAEFF